MKIRLFPAALQIVLIAASCSSGSGVGRVYEVQPGVTVYEPAGYDSSQHSPSPIFLKELRPCGGGVSGLDAGLCPKFYRVWGKSVVSIDAGDADLYGGGEVSGNLRRNGDSQTIWNTDNPTGLLDKGKRMYQSHPWLLGVRKDGSAFGIIADNTWKTFLSMKGRVRFRSEGPAFRVVIIEKDSPQEVLNTLADLSGKMELPPLWALGYQQCRFSYYPQERVASLADTIRSHRIPCDVIWMDIHYMDWYKIFTFNPQYFPDPKGLNDYLHNLNFKSVYMIDPGVKAEEGYFVNDQGLENDFFVRDAKGKVYSGKVWPGECHFPDFTDPDVCRWWSGLYKDFMATGVDGVWNDMNEPSVFVDFGGTMPSDNVHKGGVDGLPEGPHARYHNIYGYLMVKASREGIKEANPGRRPFVLSRANFLGGQRYAASWTGDNFSDYSQMKESVPMCLNIGLSGQPFTGPDLGGFMRDCTPDLLRHWMASGIFFPFARNHASVETRPQEPWAFDPQTEDICRTAIERRYRLLPYYYTLFEEASRTGVPVMRPIFWSNPKDLTLREEQQAYLIGNDLMIIPRWSESPVLPQDGWNRFCLEKEDDGYQAYLALRQGAALPITGIFQNTVEYRTDSLTVLANTGSDGKADGYLYEDEGDGYGYLEGNFARYKIEVQTVDGKVNLRMRQVEGKLEKGPRAIRIGYVCDDGIIYSQWAGGDSVSMPEPKSSKTAIAAENLEFVYLENGSISKKQTKMELILSNIVN